MTLASWRCESRWLGPGPTGLLGGGPLAAPVAVSSGALLLGAAAVGSAAAELASDADVLVPEGRALTTTLRESRGTPARAKAANTSAGSAWALVQTQLLPRQVAKSQEVGSFRENQCMARLSLEAHRQGAAHLRGQRGEPVPSRKTAETGKKLRNRAKPQISHTLAHWGYYGCIIRFPTFGCDYTSSMNRLSAILPATQVLVGIDATSKKRAFEEAGLLFENLHGLSRALVTDSLFARERLGSTGLGHGVAIPHGRIKGLKAPMAAVFRLNQPIGFDAPDEIAVGLLIFLLVPEAATQKHLEILSEIAELLSDAALREKIKSAEQVDVLHGLISRWQSAAMPLAAAA